MGAVNARGRLNARGRSRIPVWSRPNVYICNMIINAAIDAGPPGGGGLPLFFFVLQLHICVYISNTRIAILVVPQLSIWRLQPILRTVGALLAHAG